MIFAEHRYYGGSQPCPGGWAECPAYLSVEQALADYAHLVTVLREQYKFQKVITFGGSYGGMLSAWFRMKYPHIIDGAIAASAPVLAFTAGGYDGSRHWATTTYTGSAVAGCEPACVDNIATAFQRIRDLSATASGRAQIASGLNLCSVPAADQMSTVLLWIMDTFDSLAMGNYPYPSSYISGDPLHPMPGYPMRVACSYLASPNATFHDLANAIGVLNNASQNVVCNNATQTYTDPISMTYNLQVCTEVLPQSDFFPAKGMPHDMFYDFTPVNLTTFCPSTYNGLEPRYTSIPQLFGLDRLKAASNIVFSNGEYDPWRSGGILVPISESIVSIYVAQGAHHLDLFFTDPRDPPSVTEARRQEMAWVDKWINE